MHPKIVSTRIFEKIMERLYQQVICEHFQQHQQMLFLAGPRQVGKTTLVQAVAGSFSHFLYLNFDVEQDRFLILKGEKAIISEINLNRLSETPPLLILDELHKYKRWKSLLKSLYDQYKSRLLILVTGSAKLDIYKKGGDSLMGRYILYRIHPFSTAEILHQPITENCINTPQSISDEAWKTLTEYGGFPDPYLKHNLRFLKQWSRLRRNQLFSEEIRTLKQVQDIAHIEMLAVLLKENTGQQLNYSNLATALRVSVDTIIRWINILEAFYYCFRLRPWHKNVKRSLVKEPKVYLWDWAEIENPGFRVENMLACHLLKAVHFWTDYGLGEYELYYLRDKEQREVDFLVTKNRQPWFLVESKLTDNQSISKSLYHYQEQLKVPYAFQVVFDLPFVNRNCFEIKEPVIVSAQTFLSQLI